MDQIMIFGAGKIGLAIAHLLSISKKYQIHIADLDFNLLNKKSHYNNLSIKKIYLDINHKIEIDEYIKQNRISALVSALPYHLTLAVARTALRNHVHYFDLTEDVNITKEIKQLTKDAKSLFISQCGVAPGFIGIVANHLTKTFNEIDSVLLRVGALPQNSTHALKYALTWSVEGLINEYDKPCLAIHNKEMVELLPLEGLEEVNFEGVTYEAFNTSGGLGNLVYLLQDKVNSLNYKTLRYPGHCKYMKFLLREMKLNQDKDTLKKILINGLPYSSNDIVIIFVSVKGLNEQGFIESQYTKKIFPVKIEDIHYSAIQIATASGICSVLDIVLSDYRNENGFFYQETIPLNKFINNKFGQYYK